MAIRFHWLGLEPVVAIFHNAGASESPKLHPAKLSNIELVITAADAFASGYSPEPPILRRQLPRAHVV
jgi:hypothetical protein